MKMKHNAFKQMVFLLVALLVTAPMNLAAQVAGKAAVPEPEEFTQEQLDRLLSPIALYPDSLLAQILMASTYPIEVVEADRWLRDHPGLAGRELDDALLNEPWDPSVKSLCHFPRVLDTMSEKLNETAELGNAFLEQRDQVMNTVQTLREKARAEGNLVSNDRQKVVVENGDIIIKSYNPDVIYIPSYDPCLVYGTWWYPACSPPWFWYPGLAVGIGLTFGPPIYIGAIGGWVGFRWHLHQIYIDVDRTHYFNRPRITRMHGGEEIWHHNPYHRRGLAYFGRETRNRHGRLPRPGVEPRRAFRGFTRPKRAIPARPRPQEGLRVPRREPRVKEHFPVRRGNAFEGFGHSRNEIRRFSERGRESMGLGRGRSGFRKRRPAGGHEGGRRR